MKNLIEFVVRGLVDFPDDVEVTEVDGDQTVIFELRCHDEDIGRVIGKQGKTISAIRTLLSMAASKQDRRAVLEVVD